MIQWIVFVITAVLLIALAVSRPFWLVSLLAIGVALEISSTWYPDLGQLGAMLGLVTLTRLTAFAIILAAFFRLLFRRDLRRKLSEAL
jgi:hypothetical protein